MPLHLEEGASPAVEGVTSVSRIAIIVVTDTVTRTRTRTRTEMGLPQAPRLRTRTRTHTRTETGLPQALRLRTRMIRTMVVGVEVGEDEEEEDVAGIVEAVVEVVADIEAQAHRPTLLRLQKPLSTPCHRKSLTVQIWEDFVLRSLGSQPILSTSANIVMPTSRLGKRSAASVIAHEAPRATSRERSRLSVELTRLS